MKNKVIEYLEKEYQECVKLAERKKADPKDLWWVNKEMCTNAIQRGLGVVMFAQTVGVSFEEIDPFYEKYRSELEELRKEVE